MPLVRLGAADQRERLVQQVVLAAPVLLSLKSTTTDGGSARAATAKFLEYVRVTKNDFLFR
jgi:hypothetical protein